MPSPGVNSLVDLLELRAQQDDGKCAFTFLSDKGGVERGVTYRELDLQSRLIASRIMEATAPGERVLLLYPPGLEFLAAFFGCLYASVIAVPAYPPHRNRNRHRLQSIFHDAQPRLALTTSALLPRIKDTISSFPNAAGIDVIATDELPAGQSVRYIRSEISQNTVAFLQYTSGSTANPKGVMLTHGNLLHNAALVNDAVGPVPDDSYVSWLPVFHDMGFMAGILQPLYRGLPSVLMAPAAFLEKPVRWLQAISVYKATASGGPSFAYELCVRRIAKADLAGIDLSSWTVAFNGAEPVRADVIDRFTSAFAQCGFRGNAFYPCYGLAEATLMVSGGRKHHLVVVREFGKKALENDRVCRPGANERAQTLVACGQNLPGQEIAIVDPESQERCASDEVGEIWVRGPSVAAGYWNNPELSQETFNAHIRGINTPFLRTGDLGFLHNEQLFITGRIKDLLIIRGQNHYPQDIELTVERCDPVLQPASGAAFSVEVGNEERLVLVQEAANRANNDWDKIFASIRRAIVENHELVPYAIVLIRTGTIPKTSSGKIQRTACKEAFATGELRVLSAWYEQEHEGPSLIDSELVTVAEPIHVSSLATMLVREIARKTGVAPDNLALDQALTSYGLDSLAAIELIHKLQVEFGLDLKMADLFEGVTLAEIVSRAQQTPTADLDLPGQTSESQTYPLTHGQRAMLFLQQMAPHSAAYYIARAVRITSKVDVDLLQRSFQALVDRHPALRTTFVVSQGELVQQVHPEARVCFERVDASSLGEARLAGILVEQSQRVFDLVNGPLLCAYLYTRSEKDHVLQVVVHHLIADFWSLVVLVHDLGQLYRAQGEINSAGLPPLKYSYADFVSWQDRLISGPQGEKLWSYWEQVLSGEIASLNLPADRCRPPVSSFRGAALEFVIDPTLVTQLKTIASGQQTTFFMVLLAAFQVLLYRLTAQARFAVGVPTSGRSRAEFSDLAGYFVNVLPFVTDFTEPTAFTELLTGLRHRAIESFAHDLYPFPLMVEKLGIPRSFNSSPIFQTMFVFQTAYASQSQDFVAVALGEHGARLDMGGLELEPYPIREQTAQFDLVLTMGEGKQGLLGTWQYSTDLFDSATVARWSQSWLQLLRGIVVDPGRLVNELPVVPEDQLARLLLEFNRTELEYDRSHLVHERIAHQALLQPNRTAVVCGTARLSYRALDLQASHIARYLHRQGVGTEDLVAICMARSPEMVAAMLGVWKTGAAYVPLDFQYPHERLRFMLDDARARFVLTEPALHSKVEGTTAKVVDVSEIPGSTQEDSAVLNASFNREQLAYLIYTSGSTGTPKGVMLTHQSVSSFVAWARNNFSPEEFSGVLATTSICFDLSIFELWATLSCGGTVILAENILESCDYWAGSDAQLPVRLINTVPSAMEKVLERGLPVGVTTINLAGEALQEALVRKIFETGVVSRVNNLYGPTETTTYSSWTTVAAEDHVTIGRAIANTQLYVLDSALQLVPIGVVGELYIGGAGLARGYWQHPDWSAECFVPNPFSTVPGERLFRTGDLVRWQANGQLLYLGRADQQVKIRGFRIELGEISAVLGRWNAVRENAVVVIENRGDKHLVGCVVPAADAELTPEEIRDYLRHRLPDYMVPSRFVLLVRLPLTPNGKIDRKRLLELEASAGVEASGATILDPTEELIAGIWTGLLGVTELSAESDFFALGGHSLLATQMLLRLRQVFGCDVALRSLFEFSRLGELAAHVRMLTQAPDSRRVAPILSRNDHSNRPPSSAQQRLWFLDQFAASSHAYNIAGAARLGGELDLEALRQSFQAIIRRHEILRTGFVEQRGRPELAHPPIKFDLQTRDLSGEAEMERRLAEELQNESTREFALSCPSLLRAILFRLGEQEHVLMVAMHHIIADAWSIEIMVRELAQFYASYQGGSGCDIPELPFQYPDYAAWEHDRWDNEGFATGLDYWRRQLADVPCLELPADFPREAAPSYQGQVLKTVLDTDLSRKLKELGRKENVTLFMLLLAGFQGLLSQYTGDEDVAVGTSVANRNNSGTENLIGLFTNEVVLRTQLHGDPSFHELLSRVREVTLSAYAHQDVPFGRLVEALQPQRDFSRSPFFQVTVLLNTDPLPQMQFGNLSLEPVDLDIETAIFDLSLIFTVGKDGRIRVALRHSTRFKTDRMETLLKDLIAVLNFMVQKPEAHVSELRNVVTSVVDREAPDSFAMPVGRPWSEFPFAGENIPHIFEQQVLATPGNIAVRFEEQCLTFAGLNEKANRVANYLLNLGVKIDSYVALCLERSADVMVAILGILKAGAAYVPLDRTYPASRLEYIVEETDAAVILTQRSLAELFTGALCRVVCIDDDSLAESSAMNPAVTIHPDNLAYAIYTSGSTGTPKGVMVQHRSVLNLLQGLEQSVYSGMDAASCVSMNAPVVFDASVKQWIRILKGNSVCILPEEKRFDPEALAAYLNEKNIDVLDCTPSVLRLLLSEGAMRSASPHPRALLIGGEAIDAPTWQRLREQGQVESYNVYGPTECTVDVSVCRISESRQPSVGYPINNVQAYVLNGSLQPLPLGQVGELYVAGIGLARGYCRRPDLTAERFIPDPISGIAGSRLYRTGDLARMLPGGRLAFCGRCDDQVKIRGYRVELEEITIVLRKLEGVRDAVVLVTQTNSGQSRLLAYVVPEPSVVLNPEQLRDGLRRQMPEYMTPSGFLILDKLPVTVNGKIDRMALALMSEGQHAASSSHAPARNRMEKVVTAVWREVLGVREPGIHDNFFDLGGHSLAMVQVRSRLREVLNKEVPMVELFRNPTIALLSRYLQEGQAKTPSLQLAQSRAGRRIKAANRVGN